MSKKYKKNTPKKNANKPIKTAYEIKEQTAYFVKNRLPAFVLAGFMIFWTIAGILGIVAYARGNTRKSTTITASAQTAEQYDYAVYEVQLTGLNGVGATMSSFGEFSVITDNPRLVFNGNSIYWSYGDSSTQLITEGANIEVQWLPVYNENSGIISMQCHTSSYEEWYRSDRYIPYSIEYNLYFDNNIDRFFIELVVTLKDRGVAEDEVISFSLSDLADDPYVSCPYIGYADIYEPINFTTPCYGVDIYTGWEWWQRYKAPSYNDGYNAGYNKGYGEGKTVGYNNGKSVGYYEGVQEANDYSFTGLLSAVFDVPVQTFTSLFNFDLLGVNLANFFYSLLTLAVILAVVKLIL